MAESASVHIKNWNGIITLVAFLEDSEVDHRIQALKLMSTLSKRLSQGYILVLLKDKLLKPRANANEECSATTYILALLFVVRPGQL